MELSQKWVKVWVRAQFFHLYSYVWTYILRGVGVRSGVGVWSVSIAVWHQHHVQYFFWWLSPLLFICTVGLNHPADVQFHMMVRGIRQVNHYRLYNARTIIWASMWVPEAKAPTTASHYSRCMVQRQDRTAVTHTAHKLDREISSVLGCWLGRGSL